MPTVIYKICTRAEWEAARTLGAYEGSGDDLHDGFIHFSSAHQVTATATKFFAGQRELLLVAVDAERLRSDLKWEPSRGGDLFPHLYGRLPLEAVIEVADLPLAGDGAHAFPEVLAP